MTPARGCFRLVLAFACLVVVLHSAEGRCSSNQIECKTGGGCINKYNICDGSSHCSDRSDEEQAMCQHWPSRDHQCGSYGSGKYYYRDYNCRDIHQVCLNSRWSRTINQKVCEFVLRNKLGVPQPQPTPGPPQEGMNMTNELVGLLSSAVNSTLTKRKPDCPMLYTRVGKDCLSFFSPAKLSWAEARHFCRSIYGDLWHFTDVAAYGTLLAFIREEQLTSDYWIGGRFDLDTNAWSWTSDDSVMPLGAPYWSLKHSASCVRRGPPHTDPFSDPPEAPPTGRCYKTELSPKKRSSGWCAAMTYENFFYWSDEKCDEAFSPLCILTEPIVPQQAADTN